MNYDNGKTKILILTDSLSLPRAYKDGIVKYDQTYISLLRNANPNVDFIHVGIGGATITALEQLVKYYIHAEPELVVLQCGIVDCAPRALNEFELLLFSKLHIMRLILPFTKLLRKYRNVTYTTEKVFRATLQKMKDSFEGISFVTLGILPGCNEYELLVPGVTKKIEKYNEILKANSEYIDNNDFKRDGIIDDWHHINSNGHIEIFNKVQRVISLKLNHNTKSDSSIFN